MFLQPENTLDEHSTDLWKITGKECIMKEHINQNVVSINSVRQFCCEFRDMFFE